QHPFLGGEIFFPRNHLLLHHPRDEGQDARPIHSSSTPADSRLIAPNNCSQRPPARLRRDWTTDAWSLDAVAVRDCHAKHSNRRRRLLPPDLAGDAEEVLSKDPSDILLRITLAEQYLTNGRQLVRLP